MSISTISHATKRKSQYLVSRANEAVKTRRLTSIVGRTAHGESPREVRAQEELHAGVVQDGLVRNRGIRGEDGIVEPGTGVVPVDVEVIVLGVGSTGGLEVEWLGGVEVLTGFQDRVGRHCGGQEGQASEDVKAHGCICGIGSLGWMAVVLLLANF